MRTIKVQDIEEIKDLIADGFAQDPKNEFQLRNIERKNFILSFQAENQLRQFMEKGDVYVLDDCKGVLVGYNSSKLDIDAFIKVITICSNELMQILSEQEIHTIINNSQLIEDVDKPLWFHEINEEYYHLLVIAIDEQRRGSGAFRELISPLLCECDIKKIPILIETHKKSNVDIYKHFGFEIIKEFTDEKIEFRQYCMIRRARPAKEGLGSTNLLQDVAFP